MNAMLLIILTVARCFVQTKSFTALSPALYHIKFIAIMYDIFFETVNDIRITLIMICSSDPLKAYSVRPLKITEDDLKILKVEFLSSLKLR